MPLVSQTDYGAIRQRLITWLEARAPGISEANIANRAFDEPAVPFAVIQVISRGKQLGLTSRKTVQNGNLIERTYISQRQMSVQVTVISDPAATDATLEAGDILEIALEALNSQQERDAWRLDCLSILDWDTVEFPDEQVGEIWRRKAVALLTLSYRTVLFDDGTDPPPDDGTFIETVDVISEDNATATWN